MQTKTVKVVSPVSNENPLGYIVINESDLTEDHEIFDEDDQTTNGPLTVAQIREVLAKLNVEIPNGMTKKADLQTLLDANTGE